MDLIEILSLYWKMLWPLGAAILFIAFFKLLFDVIIPESIEIYKNKVRFKSGKRWRADRDLITWLKGMHPTDFEKYVAELFKNLGYNAEAVGRSHDGGVDVILEKDGKRSYVQCKKYLTSVVSVSEVRDFYGALADHLSEGQGYFITTNKFTLEAIKFAADKPIELIDSFKLVEYIRLAQKNGFEDKAANVVVNENCPRCGNKLVERDGQRGKFIGCSGFPKCRFTKSI